MRGLSFRDTLREPKKPLTKDDMDSEMRWMDQMGSVRDTSAEFDDATIVSVLDAIGLGDSKLKSENNARSNLDNASE